MEHTSLYYLTQAVKLAALDCSEQISLFPNFVAVPDEIAIILHETLLVFERSGSKSLVEPDMFAKIRELDTYFDSFSETEFTTEALCNSPRWSYSRDIAREILALLGADSKRPDLSWMRFVKSN